MVIEASAVHRGQQSKAFLAFLDDRLLGVIGASSTQALN